MAGNQERREIFDESIRAFSLVSKQLGTFYKEIGFISKKKPSEPLNKFKLGFINQTVAKANELLGDEFRPFPDFLLFDVDGSLPTASDVVIMLAHYQEAMDSFRATHSTYREWNRPKPETEDTEEDESDDDLEEDEEDDEFDDEDDETEE